MDIRPIRTEADYDWALAEVEQYFVHEPEPGTEEADRFDVLSALIEAYEAKVWPIEAPDAVDAMKAIHGAFQPPALPDEELRGWDASLTRQEGYTHARLHRLLDEAHLFCR